MKNVMDERFVQRTLFTGDAYLITKLLTDENCNIGNFLNGKFLFEWTKNGRTGATGTEDEIKTMIGIMKSKGFSFSPKNDDGNTPFMILCENPTTAYPTIIGMVNANVADDVLRKDGTTVIETICSKNEQGNDRESEIFAVAKRLIQNGFTVESGQRRTNSICETKNPKAMVFLLKHGHSFLDVDNFSWMRLSSPTEFRVAGEIVGKRGIGALPYLMAAANKHGGPASISVMGGLAKTDALDRITKDTFMSCWQTSDASGRAELIKKANIVHDGSTVSAVIVAIFSRDTGNRAAREIMDFLCDKMETSSHIGNLVAKAVTKYVAENNNFLFDLQDVKFDEPTNDAVRRFFSLVGSFMTVDDCDNILLFGERMRKIADRLLFSDPDGNFPSMAINWHISRIGRNRKIM